MLTDASQHLAEKPAETRPARARVLPVAEIFAVHPAESVGGHVVASVVVGDERNPPKRHGLRATRARWLQFVLALADEDPALANLLREGLAQVSAFPPRLPEPVAALHRA